MSSTWFKLLLCDIDSQMVEAWKQNIVEAPCLPVEYCNVPFQDVMLPFDCVVSPANSFGLMDGGIDLYISRYFGGVTEFVPRVQKALLDEFCGQQPVGTSFIIPTGRSEGCRWLAHTPTMRLPQYVGGSDVAYRAMWAMLVAVRNHNRRNPGSPIRTVLCPGFATGVGGMAFEEAAKQMALAYKHFTTNPADTDTDATSDAPGSKGYMVSWNFALKTQGDIRKVVDQNNSSSPC